MRRVGWDIHSEHPGQVFEQRGTEQWQLVKSLLPDGMTNLAGKRILDFGCGVGRILRAAVRDADAAEFAGCDIHLPSVRWLQNDLRGRARIFQTDDWPPIEAPDGHFDVIYAFSVYTHLVDSWSAWLLELRRVLKDEGVLIITVFGPGHTSFAGEPISEEIIGMNVLYPSASWDVGGPLIAHSEWWLRAHWGRAFEIVELRLCEPAGPPPLFGQGLLVLRKRSGELTVQDLERAEPDEPREIAALKQNVLSLRREVARHAELFDSKSWKMTAPLRAAARVARSEFARHRSS
jgi:SAM-dependent methyltransferase